MGVLLLHLLDHLGALPELQALRTKEDDHAHEHGLDRVDLLEGGKWVAESPRAEREGHLAVLRELFLVVIVVPGDKTEKSKIILRLGLKTKFVLLQTKIVKAIKFEMPITCHKA